ncbi:MULTISPECIES: LacI family DNA-binding transcriptional regulator [unclassified Fredinandcohnia]|mgnify:CR=1 FL=1|uniref:LacI family DNA-binding transcriptional regulator n=1 Tax=unclassified Fredinandcohnia TaxID=2837514 RepID=UPI0030FDE9EB
MVRLKDIAEHVGVSISTVSRVIQNDKSRNVKPETIQKVWNAVKELGYVPNENARKLVTNQSTEKLRTMKIGWVANPKIAELNPYFSRLYEGVNDTLIKSDYSLTSINKEELQNESLLFKTIHESGIEGLILIDHLEQSVLDYIMQFIPIVGLDFFYTDKELTVIDYDRESAVKKAIKELVKQGHQKIGFLGGGVGENFKNLNEEKRYKGYRNALEEFGLNINPEWVINTEWNMKKSYFEMSQLIQTKSRNLPTAIFCASDLMAIAAMRAVTENELKIPDDIAFISIDNIDMSQYSSPPLSTIDVPKYELGAIAAKTIVDIVEGKITLPMKILLPNKLIVRESSNFRRL